MACYESSNHAQQSAYFEGLPASNAHLILRAQATEYQTVAEMVGTQRNKANLLGLLGVKLLSFQGRSFASACAHPASPQALVQENVIAHPIRQEADSNPYALFHTPA